MPRDTADRNGTAPLTIIGSRSPEFSVQAIVGGKIVNLTSLDLLDRYALLFFYPNDFSIVCPTELMALQHALPEFEQRSVEVIGISVDSIEAHQAWLLQPESDHGISGVTFKLVSDVRKELARAFCVLDEDAGICHRGVFLLDRDSLVVYGAVNNLDVGRNIEELLRIVDAAQHTEQYVEWCPADWRPGARTIGPGQEGIMKYYGARSARK